VCVAYQGVPGAYSEGAALAAFPGGRPLPCAAFDAAFEALAGGLADRAVLPIENSLGGSIHAVYDLLLRHRLHIVGEVAIGVDHCLLALPGTALSDITSVASHPQALAQCDGYLRSLGVARVAADDTAGAAGKANPHRRRARVGAGGRPVRPHRAGSLRARLQRQRDPVSGVGARPDGVCTL
jgi:arogenate/prephenate dehydratase